MNMSILKNSLPAYFAPLFSLDYFSLLSTAPLFLFIFSILFLSLGAYLFYDRLKKELAQKYTILEIKPPAISLQSSFSTEKLFTMLHSLEHHYTFVEKLLKVKKTISYEIISTRENGIRYILRVPTEDISIIRKSLFSYTEGVEIIEASDYLPLKLDEPERNTYEVVEFTLTRPFIFPLQKQDALKQYDPIAYLTGHMTKLEPNDLVAFQVVTIPVTHSFHGGLLLYLNKLIRLIQQEKDINPAINKGIAVSLLKLVGRLCTFALMIVWEIFTAIMEWLADFLSSQPKNYRQHLENSLFYEPMGEKILTPQQKYKQEMILGKIEQKLFKVSMRLVIKSDSKESISSIREGIKIAFETFTNEGYQSLKPKSKFPITILLLKKLTFLEVKNRLLSFSRNPILSNAELTSIYHFPYTKTTHTEDMVLVKSPQLPAPRTLKKANGNLDITFAVNVHGDIQTPIGLTLEERRRHVYIKGQTGQGKSTMMLQMIYQDILHGKGMCLIDPEGDISYTLIGVIPKERLKDVVYINPHDIKHPFSLNILELPKGLTGADLQVAKDLVVSDMIGTLYKLYDGKYMGPRMENTLRNAILAVLETEKPTLVTVYRFLTTTKFRNKIVKTLTDPLIKSFWNNEFEPLTLRDKAEQVSPITNKLGKFLTTSLTREILKHERSTIDFDEIMNTKKIVIFNLSRGKIGEDVSSFLGSLIMAKFQQAAQRRVHIPQDERVDFFLYIDEFQYFATSVFAQLFSGGRKYRVSITVAHQNVSQIKDEDLLDTIIANSGTDISFRITGLKDEAKILPLFIPQVGKYQLANLPSYCFYIKINALIPQDAFTGTVEDFTVKEDEEVRQAIIKFSRQTYGIKVDLKKERGAASVLKSSHNQESLRVSTVEQLFLGNRKQSEASTAA